MKIAFPCGASSKFHRCFIKNRAPVQSILKIPSIFRSKSRSRAEHPENAEENCAPPAEHPQNSVGISFKIALPCGACILKMLMKIAPPCGASSKFRRYIRSKSRSRAEHPKNFAANRVPYRSILKISSLLHQKSRSRAEPPELFE